MKKGKRRGLITVFKHHTYLDTRFWELWGEDGRKVGLAATAAGLIGLFTNSGKISTVSSVHLLFIGLGIWLICAMLYTASVKITKMKEES